LSIVRGEMTMTYYVNRNDVRPDKGEGHVVYWLLDEKHGCKAGCRTGISVYDLTEYSKPGVHDDQEGFYVIDGSGWARLGDREFRIESEGSFIVPAKTAHTLKKDPSSGPLKVFWFHAAV
jgi:mannose-6-phosphate isomerase-like protein (cupin superfamily)